MLMQMQTSRVRQKKKSTPLCLTVIHLFEIIIVLQVFSPADSYIAHQIANPHSPNSCLPNLCQIYPTARVPGA